MFDFINKSVSFIRKTIDTCIGKTAVEAAASPTELIKSHSNHPVIGRNDIHQLNVIDQRHDGCSRGDENCGYHAFRNALVLLQLYGYRDGKYLDLLQNQHEFLEAYGKWVQLVPSSRSGARDIDIATLHTLLEHIPEDASISPPNTMAERQQGLPLMSVVNASVMNQELHYSRMGGPLALEAAANLWRVAHSPDVNLTHAFVIGIFPERGMPHWVTMVLRQEGSRKEWIMMDSYANQTKYTQFLAEKLDALLQNSDEAAQVAYRSNVSDLIERRAGWVNPQTHDVTNEHAGKDKTDFLDSHEFKDMAIKSFQFMKKCQWLDHYQGHETEIKHLATIVGFYASQLPNNSPDLASFKTMHEELNLVTAAIDRPRAL